MGYNTAYVDEPEGYVQHYSGILLPKESTSEDISIKVYEREGSPLKKIYDMWYKQSEAAVMDQLKKDTVYHDDGTFDIVYDQLAPKVKWFRPPLTLRIWKFEIDMTWAYRTEKCYLLKNCRMTAKSDMNPNNDQKEMVMNWDAFPHKGSTVDAQADFLMEQFRELSKDEEEDFDVEIHKSTTE